MDGDGLIIETSRLDDCDVVSLAGELDCVTVPSLAATLKELEKLERPIVLDLGDLRFIDSSGLHALLNSGSEKTPRALVCPPGHIARLLSIVQANLAIAVYERLDDALAAAQASNGGNGTHTWLRRRRRRVAAE